MLIRTRKQRAPVFEALSVLERLLMKRVFAISFIALFSFVIILVGALGFYALIQIPDRHPNLYIWPLYLVVGILLIISVFNIYKNQKNSFIGLKLAFKLLVLVPVLYLLACLDSSLISGLEFASSIPIILLSALCYWLMKFVPKNA